MNDITISRVEYELLLRAKTKLEIVKSTVEKDNDSVFGYTSGTRTVLEAVLGIERKEKSRLRYCSTQSARKEQSESLCMFFSPLYTSCAENTRRNLKKGELLC